MKFFEKNIKDRFKNASSLEGIDPNDLWSNIESSIATESPKRKFIFFRKRYLLGLLFLFLIGGAIVWNQVSDEKPLAKNTNNTVKPTIENQNIDSNNSDQKNITQAKSKDANESKVELTQASEQNDKTKNPPSTNSSENKNNSLLLPPKTTQEPISFITKNTPLNSNDNSEANINKSELDNNKIQKELTPAQNNVLKNEQLFDGQEIDFTKIASIDFLISQEDEEELDLNDLIKFSTKDKKIKFSLGIFTGIHTVKNQFSSQLSSDKERRDLLNQGFQYELGHSYALEANVQLNKNIFITSGLEYVKSISEFNLVKNWKTVIVNPNSPVGALTDASATRTVRHHNKMNYLSVPILFGFQKSFRKMELGMSAGIGLNFTKSQTGKSLNFNDEVTSYPTAENKVLPVSNFFTSYHLRPYLNYALAKKVSLQLRIDVRYQNFGKSDFYQLKYNSILGGISGGVQYQF